MAIQINVLKFDYMLRNWDINDDLPACWDLYISGTKVLPASDDEVDSFPSDDALLLGCYTLVKAYNMTSTLFTTRKSNNRTTAVFITSCALSRSGDGKEQT
jgi:hypothetical protein